MATSIYLSNNMIQVVVGNKSNKMPAISQVIQEIIPEGSILNGIITNDVDLMEHIQEIWRTHQLPTKEVELVINSAKVSTKMLTVAKLPPKKVYSILPLEFTDVDVTGNALYDYAIWEEFKDSKTMEIMGIVAEEAYIRSFVELFEKLGVSLSRITFARGVIRRFLSQVSVLKQDASVILMIDGNALVTLLWVDDKYVYMDKKRLFVEQGTAGFVNEAIRSINNIAQLHSSQKIDKPLKHVYTIGISQTDIEEMSNQISEYGLPYDCQSLPCEHAEAVFAGGALITGAKDMNFISLLQSKKKEVKKESSLLKTFLPVGIVFVVCALATIAIFLVRGAKENELADLTTFITSSPEALKMPEYEKLSAQVTKANAMISGVAGIHAILDSYPVPSSMVKNSIRAQAASGVDVEFIGYDSATGALDMRTTVNQADEIETYINRLQDTGLFSSIEYTGFTFQETQGNYMINVSCYLSQTAGR